jgi:hypothetical protein
MTRKDEEIAGERGTGATKWICWHPDLGYLRFGSYNVGNASAEPDPRSCFSRRSDAEGRQRGTFYCRGKPYLGSGVVIRRVRMVWEVLPDE